MFTGIVEEIGIIHSIAERSGSRAFTIGAVHVMNDLSVGDSIAVSGVCLTVVARGDECFEVVAVEETLRKTNLGLIEVGSTINLERALLPTTRLGGHFVTGHVEALGCIVELKHAGIERQLWVECPTEKMRYVVPLGSIALDGISLTIARVEHTRFMVAIIPHTWEHTTLHHRRIGDSVNLEFDIIAKYVERLLQSR
ncbi:MAG: riboflavin synthase [Chlorobi bacterium]|nr:riboflavin synthase [Chlorobiota bacterium]